MMRTIDRPAVSSFAARRPLVTSLLVTPLLVALLLALAAAAPIAAEDIPAPPNVAAPPADVERTESGLAHKLLEPGDGDASPRQYDLVLVDYTGWTTDGKVFDSSVARGKPAGLPLHQLIPGWQEGIRLMVAGEKRRFWIPSELAYAGAEGKPQGMLVFDVELIRFETRTPPDPPEHVAGPPADAEAHRSGIHTKVLKAGAGSESPTARSTVTVHYTGWTTDGQRFDSSIPRGNAVVFPLSDVIKGWKEGLQLMVVGEKRRMWIPESLAYKGKKGQPPGMLVFDVELLGIGN